MSRAVSLDASAVLAVLNSERGHEQVVPHLAGGMISAVNFSEVIQKAVQRGGELATVTLHLERLMLDVVPFDALQAERAAAVWPAARPLGLSFADRACLALGILRATTVLTADRQMAETGLPVKVKLIRRHA